MSSFAEQALTSFSEVEEFYGWHSKYVMETIKKTISLLPSDLQHLDHHSPDAAVIKERFLLGPSNNWVSVPLRVLQNIRCMAASSESV